MRRLSNLLLNLTDIDALISFNGGINRQRLIFLELLPSQTMTLIHSSFESYAVEFIGLYA